VGVPGLTWLGFGVAAGLLLAATVRTARPPAGRIPDRAEYLRRWSPLHGGYDPGRRSLTRGWLGLVYRAARPLAVRGVAADALTGCGVLVSLAVPAIAGHRGRWPLLAVLAVLLAGLLDSLDGAVAALTGRATGFGYVLDSVADRVSDAAQVVALWALGAPAWLCLAGGGASGLQEYARARAGAAGMTELAVLTVFERPTRVLLTAFLLLGCGLLPGWADRVATAGAAAWAVLGAAALAQLLLAARRRLGR
jgi:CDP-diacylglycerol--glycerol-3-phosphate 3-phosphatidyltransferase